MTELVEAWESMLSAEWLAQRFDENRGHLRAVVYRMLGSANEADDAVQESWLRLSRADASEIDNLGAWLTTVVARVPGYAALAHLASGGFSRRTSVRARCNT